MIKNFTVTIIVPDFIKQQTGMVVGENDKEMEDKDQNVNDNANDNIKGKDNNLQNQQKPQNKHPQKYWSTKPTVTDKQSKAPQQQNQNLIDITENKQMDVDKTTPSQNSKSSVHTFPSEHSTNKS